MHKYPTEKNLVHTKALVLGNLTLLHFWEVWLTKQSKSEAPAATATAAAASKLASYYMQQQL